MYLHHNNIKQRIKNHELTGFEYVERYKAISTCLLLCFSMEPKVKSIREHLFKEYEKLLT